MSKADQREFGFLEPRRHLRRGVYLLPSALTVGNLLCGFYAVLATVSGGVMDLNRAARAIGFAMVFDAFDGFVARATHTNTDFGKQLDSLADMVSFGIAPAILAYTWGVSSMVQTDTPEAQHMYDVGWIACLAFALCSAWRLARFNVQGMAPGGLPYFIGMPTPAAAGMIAAMVYAWKAPIKDWRWSAAWLVLVLLLSALMVSTIRFASLKGIPVSKRQHSLMIVVFGLFVWSIVVYSEIVLLLIASAYVVVGIVTYVVHLLRLHPVWRMAKVTLLGK